MEAKEKALKEGEAELKRYVHVLQAQAIESRATADKVRELENEL